MLSGLIETNLFLKVTEFTSNTLISTLMKQFILLLTALSATVCMAQPKNVAGTYSCQIPGPFEDKLTLCPDSTFQYSSKHHPHLYTWEWGYYFYENGQWTISGDTIILNPQLTPTIAVQTDFQEEEIPGDTALTLTFTLVKRYFDDHEDLIQSDTEQISEVDFAFNKKNHKTTTAVTYYEGKSRFAANTINTKSRTIVVPRPDEPLTSIYIFCFETNEGVKQFMIRNPQSTHLIYTVFYNFYKHELRQKKLLIKNENALFTKQKPNGKFYKEFSQTDGDYKLTRVRSKKN
jgi:hypothetical protein